MFPMINFTDRVNNSSRIRTISKFSSEREFHNNKRWKCFGCYHVQTATVLLGIWHLSLHVTGILMIITVLVNPQFFITEDSASEISTVNFESNYILVDELGPATTADPLVGNNTNADLCKQNEVDDEELKLWIVLTFVSLMTNVMLIYGTLCNKPTLMVPFFCLQLFDFLITVSAIFTYSFVIPNTTDIFKSFNNKFPLPFQHMYSRVSTIQVKSLAISVMVFAVIIKLYLLNVVWRCYKFLMMRQLIRIHGMNFDAGDDIIPPSDDHKDLSNFPAPPPSYDDVINQRENIVIDIPPPRYSSNL